MHIRILGPLEAERDGTPLELGAPRLRSILAQLVLARGKVVSVDRLVDTTWDGAPPPHATATLHSYISTLRRVLEPERAPGAEPRRLVTRAPGYALLRDGVTVDADEFAAAVAAARDRLRSGDPEGALVSADRALAMWRGPVLADLADEPFVRDAAVALDELRVTVAEDRLEAATRLELPSTIADAEELVAAHPGRERPLLLLLTALYRAGRVAEALDRYETARRQLADEYGLDPTPALQRLHLAMLRGEAVEPPPTAPADAAPDASPAPRPAASGEDVLVGRDHERALIAAFLGAVREARTRWLVWHGEPGIGKTRLAEEVSRLAGAAGCATAWARCPEDGDAPPHWPIAQLLRASGADPDEVLSDPAQLDVDAATRRYLVHERMAASLRLLAAVRPLVVVVDDVHWADTATLDALRYCAGQLRDAPIGFVLTVRSGLRRPEVDALVGTVARQTGAVTHEVPPLAPTNLRELAAHLTGEPLSDAQAVALAARTGGNAFFATELLRLPAAERARDAAAALPLTVRQVVARRLEALPEDTRAILTVGAVVGLVFDLPLVASAGGVAEERALEHLDPALAAGVVSRADRLGHYAFAHALVRDAILGELSAAHRVRIHARIAAAMEHLDPSGTARGAADRAHHLVAAVPLVPPDEARAAARQAATLAEAQFAYVEAADWWETVEQLEPPTAELPEVLTAIGRCLLQAGRIADGRTRIAAAIAAALDLGDPAVAATAAAQLRASGGAWPWVRPGEVPSRLLALIEQVLAGLPTDAARARAATLITYAIGLHYHPDRARMLATTEQALAAARSAGDQRLLADVLLGACTAVWSVDAVGRMLALTDELLSLPPDATPPSVEGAARLVRINVRWTLGAFDEADRELTRLRRLSGDVCSLWLHAQLAWAEVALDVARGEFDRALHRMPDALRAHEVAGLYESYGNDAAARMLVHALDGTLAALDDRHDAAVAGSAGRHELPGLRQLAHGDVERALTSLRTGRADPPFAHDRLATLALQAWLATELAAAPLTAAQRAEVDTVARALLEELVPYEGHVAALGTFLVVGPVSLWTGRLREAVDGPGAGAEQLAAARRLAESTGMRPFADLADRFAAGRRARATSHR